MRRQMCCVTVILLCVPVFAVLIPRAASHAADVRWVEVENSFYYPKLIPAVVYDESEERILMFGGQITISDVRGDLGFSPTYVSNQLLAFKDGTWSMLNQYNHLSVIPPRISFLFTWDQGGNRMIFAGGGAGYYVHGDVWAFDGQTLQRLFEDETTRANNGGALFYNSQINQVCLLGTDGKLYELQSSRWVSLNDASPAGWGGGEAMFAFKVSYSPTSKKLVVFGGQEIVPGPTPVFDVTYVYDAAANSWSRPNPDPQPAARAWHTLAYHPGRSRHVLVGGFRDATPPMSDAWEFDDATNTWSELGIENPISMYNNALVHDSAQGKLFVVAGHNDGHWADRIYELRYIPSVDASGFTMY